MSGFWLLLSKLVILQKVAPSCSTQSLLSLVSEDSYVVLLDP